MLGWLALIMWPSACDPLAASHRNPGRLLGGATSSYASGRRLGRRRPSSQRHQVRLRRGEAAGGSAAGSAGGRRCDSPSDEMCRHTHDANAHRRKCFESVPSPLGPDPLAGRVRPAVSMRSTQVYLMAMTRFMCYLTRGQVGVILPYLSTELHLSQHASGQLLSRYASGYLLTQILGGLCADQYGAVPIMAFGIAMSALLNFVAAGAADVQGIAGLGALMFVMGMAQGVVMPAGNVLVARWVLPSERSWASGLGGLGACAGGVAVNTIATPIAAHFGWRTVYYCTSCFCGALLLVWSLCGASRPQDGSIAAQTPAEELKLLI
eukprot:COSAG01_NODE_19035_length_1035_cov_1.144231_1_plen_321_part_01